MTRKQQTAAEALRNEMTRSNVQPINGPRDLLFAIFNGGDVSLDIPLNAPSDKVFAGLTLVGGTIKEADTLKDKLAPVFGRYLLEVKTRELWKELGFKKWLDWLMERVDNRVTGLGIGKSRAYEMIAYVERFPTLTSAQMLRFGGSRLYAASKITSSQDPQHLEILEASMLKTVGEFEQFVSDFQQNALSAASADGNGETVADSVAAEPETINLSLRVPPALATRFKRCCEDNKLNSAGMLDACLSAWEQLHPTVMPTTASTNQTIQRKRGRRSNTEIQAMKEAEQRRAKAA